MARAYLGLGTNLGDRQANIDKALDCLNRAGIEVKKLSSIYETEPVGGPLQGMFLNAVAEVETALRPKEFLGVLKDIEKELGRRPGPRNFPRVIDLDILFYADEVLNEEGLVIPHPRVHERDFVLKGLAEIAPEKVPAR